MPKRKTYINNKIFRVIHIIYLNAATCNHYNIKVTVWKYIFYCNSDPAAACEIQKPLPSHDASHFAISAIIRASVRICNRRELAKIKTVAADYSELMEGFYIVSEFYFIARTIANWWCSNGNAEIFVDGS